MATYNRQMVDADGTPIFTETNPAFIKQSESISHGSLYGSITVEAETPTLVKLGESQLAGRHSVLIINSGTTEVYVGFDDAVTGGNGIPIAASQERLFALNPLHDVALYVYSKTATTLKVVELK